MCGENSSDRRGLCVHKMEAIKDVLQRLGYHRTRILPLRRKEPSPALLAHEMANLLRFVTGGRNTFGVTLWPGLYEKLFGLMHGREELLYQLLFLNKALPRDLVVKGVGEEAVQKLVKTGILGHGTDDPLAACVRVVPYREGLYFTDTWDRRIPGMAYLSYDSLFLADWLRSFPRDRYVDRSLDLCTGVGVLACTLSEFCRVVVRTDINPRAVSYARLNARLNHRKNVTFSVMDLFGGVRGRFDLIISNPPFVFLPETDRPTMLDSFGGDLGIEVTLKILAGMNEYLSEDGRALVISKAPVVGGKDALLEGLRDLYRFSGWKVLYTQIADAVIPPQQRAFYQTHGISGLKMVVISLERGNTFQLVRDTVRLGSLRYQF